jgi:uncharacterized protein
MKAMVVAGSVVWFELWVPDVELAKQFYGRMFGWTFTAMTEYDAQYWLVKSGSGLAGAILPGDAANVLGRVGTAVYVAVEDLGSAVERCLELGGAVEQGATDIGDGTRFALIRDPFGIRVGLWTDGAVTPRTAAD